jgi:hypothetical protein
MKAMPDRRRTLPGVRACEGVGARVRLGVRVGVARGEGDGVGSGDATLLGDGSRSTPSPLESMGQGGRLDAGEASGTWEPAGAWEAVVEGRALAPALDGARVGCRLAEGSRLGCAPGVATTGMQSGSTDAGG